MYLRNYKFISQNFFIILGIFILLPFFVLSCFNHPSCDDFWFYSQVKDYGFWGSQKWSYFKWSGRYFSNFIINLNPLMYHSFIGYKLFCIPMIIMLLYSLYYFMNAIGFDFLSRRAKSVFSLMILSIYLYKMPSIAQGIYWVPGAIFYLLPNIFTLIFFSFLIQLLKDKDKLPRLTSIVIAILLLFFTVGSNEISMCLLVLLLYFSIILDFLINGKVDKKLLLMVICATAFSLIVILAPGNTIRSERFAEYGQTNQHLLIFSLYSSIKDTIHFTSSWLLGTPIVIFTFIFLPIGSKIARHLIKKNNNLFQLHPLIVFCGFLCIITFSFFPGYWSSGGRPPLRTINVTYFYFILGWFYLIQVTITFCKKRYNYSFSKLPQYVWAFIILSIGIYIGSNNFNNVKIAYYDLIKGSAYQYNEEMNDRYEFLNGNCENCTIKKIKNHPRTLFFYDAKDDESDYVNMSMSKFFNKKSIKVSD